MFNDKRDSVSTLLKTNPENKRIWLEELCNTSDVLEDEDFNDRRSYLLSYRGKKGGTRLIVNRSGILVLYAMDDRTIKPISEAEAREYLKTLPKTA